MFEGDRVAEFFEKPEKGDGWINGGFFVLNRKVMDYIKGDETVWEQNAVETLAREGHLDGLSPLWILVTHGYHEREKFSGKPLALRQGPMENMVCLRWSLS